MRRLHFPTYLFIILIFIELYTSTYVLLKTYLSEEAYELVSALTGLLRIFLLGYISYKFTGELKKLYVYIIVDNLFMLSILAMITYFYLLYSNIKEEEKPLEFTTIFSFIVYCFLLFFLNGNFRCLMKYAKWTKTFLIIYKLNRIYAVVFYIFLAAYNTAFHKIKEEQRESYLLFVITTSVYYSEFVFFISQKDQTHHIRIDYEIIDHDNHSENQNITNENSLLTK